MKEFEHIETLENAVKWDYFRRVLNWDIDKIAYEMHLNKRRLKEWIGKRASIITKMIKSDQGRVEAIRNRLEKEYPLPKEEEKKRLKLDHTQVAKKYNEGYSLPELAKIFKCDQNVFRHWWNEDLSKINQELKKERARLNK